ncbi:MAG: thermonuclease family protein [Chloroflexi bacterium]|nr:thermonuclease family protein [Chloroflexota bacterium]
MKIKVFFCFFIALGFTGCAAMASQIGEEMAPQISTEIAVQVSAAVVEQVATVMANKQLASAINPLTTPSERPSEGLGLTPYDCEHKYCKDMTSCEEAVYKLYVCNHERRDSDNDGVPCESMCRGADVPAIATSFAGISPTPIPTSPPGSEDIGLVTRVIDGDTIDVLLNGVNTRVRYLQMNTTERGEVCYREATDANSELVLGKTVRLVADQEKVDRYDRLLRFIYVGDALVNRVLVEQGFAEVVLYPPNDAHFEEFKRLEQEASAAGRGCHPTGIFDDGSYTR